MKEIVKIDFSEKLFKLPKPWNLIVLSLKSINHGGLFGLQRCFDGISWSYGKNNTLKFEMCPRE